MIKKTVLIFLFMAFGLTVYSQNGWNEKEEATSGVALFSNSSPQGASTSDAEWLCGSWGVTFPVYGGERLDSELEAIAYDYRAGAQEILDSLPSVGHIMTNLSYFAHSHYFTLRQNDNVDVAAEIHESLVPSLENEKIILDVLQTFKDSGKKVIVYISTGYMVRASDEAQAAWLSYYTTKFGGDEYAAYENLIEGFIKRIGHLVDGYWLDTTDKINDDGKMGAFYTMIKATDPGAIVSANLNKNYFKDASGNFIKVDTDGLDDEDSIDYKIVLHEPLNVYQDFTNGHVTPLGQGAPPNSWAYEEYTIPNMVAEPWATYNGKMTLKHAWFPVREQWHVAKLDLVFETEQAYRFAKRLVDGKAGITFANTMDYGVWKAGYMMRDEMVMMKEINDRFLMDSVPDFEPYVRPEGALLVGETLPDGFQSITFPEITEQHLGDANVLLTATASSGLPVTYSSSDSSVAVVVKGEVRLLSAGATTISAFQEGNVLFDAARSKTQLLTVIPENVNGENIALFGTATQSTNHPDGGGEAPLAIDGNTDGRYSKGSLTRTSNESNPWWQVDLGSNYTIGELLVFSRTDACCNTRLGDFAVFVLDSNGDTTFSKSYTTYPDPFVTMDAAGVQGQIIKVQMYTGASVLNLAEVQVYEVPNSVTLKVIDEVSKAPIPFASLAIRNRNYTSNRTGEISIILAQSQYAFTLSKEGYYNVDELLTIATDSSVVLQMTAKEQYELSFQITDRSTNENLAGAEIAIDNEIYISDSLGGLSLVLYEGEYDYSPSLEGYGSLNQSVALSKDTLVLLVMDKLKHTVEFQLKDFSTQGNLSGVQLSIDDETYISDSFGGISLVLYDGAYDYTLTLEGYDDVNQSIDLTQDTLLALEMDNASYTLSFKVRHTVTYDPISKALILVNETLYATHAQGELALVLDYGEYDCIVSKEGYNGDSISLFLSNDTILTLFMSAQTGLNRLEENGIAIYPNPANDVLTIDMANSALAIYEIYSISGESLRQGHLSSDENKIDVADLKSGVYFVQIIQEELVICSKIMKQN